MNLHQLAAGAIGAVNPFISVLYRRSNGYTTDSSFKRVPAYQDFPGTAIQLQGLSASDTQHTDALNINGLLRSVHVNGDVQAVDRASGKGGDLFIINGDTWLVVLVLETWPDWSRVVIQKQIA
jgi:hypothetical protein